MMHSLRRGRLNMVNRLLFSALESPEDSDIIAGGVLRFDVILLYISKFCQGGKRHKFYIKEKTHFGPNNCRACPNKYLRADAPQNKN